MKLIISLTRVNIIFGKFILLLIKVIIVILSAMFSETRTSDHLCSSTFFASLTVTPHTYVLTQINVNVIMTFKLWLTLFISVDIMHIVLLN